jgi:aerobic carbon-monoxide dehydrogenase large subunit
LYVVLQEARQKLALIASHLLDYLVTDICFQDRRVFPQHALEHHVPFSQLVTAAYNTAQLPPGMESELDFRGSHTLRTSPYVFAAHVAVVEVSQETGAVRVLHYVAVHDAGRIINPLLAAEQVHGAIAQGVGQALLEGMVYSPEGQACDGQFARLRLAQSEHHARVYPGHGRNAVTPESSGRQRHW